MRRRARRSRTNAVACGSSEAGSSSGCRLRDKRRSPISPALALAVVMAGHSAFHKGVYARLRRALDARERAYVPAIHGFVVVRKMWMPGSADKFTQSAQA